MSHVLDDFPKILWCECSAFWWCSEFNILHHFDYLCRRFTKGFVWCIRLHYHRYKLNRMALMVMARSKYQPLTKAMFSSLKKCGNILNIFGVILKPSKLPYKINWGTWICIVLIEIVVCDCLCLVLVISKIGFTEDKTRGKLCS